MYATSVVKDIEYLIDALKEYKIHRKHRVSINLLPLLKEKMYFINEIIALLNAYKARPNSILLVALLQKIEIEFKAGNASTVLSKDEIFKFDLAETLKEVLAFLKTYMALDYSKCSNDIELYDISLTLDTCKG